MLVRHFLGTTDPTESSEGDGDPASLERRLDDKVRSARAAWPGVEVPPEDFAARLGEVVREDGFALDALRADDLWLALGCVLHDPAALLLFEREIMEDVRSAVERVIAKGMSADDTMQAVREKLIVGGMSPGTPPKLAQYTGKGPLARWVRVVAVREALFAQRGHRHRFTTDDAELLAPEPGRGGIELEVLRARHGDAFRTAVQEALRRLTSEQRTLLRFSTRDGLSIDQLAPMLGVHRATAARRLAKARSDALDHTRSILRETSGLSASEARSLCIALASEVDVSISRALQETTAR